MKRTLRVSLSVAFCLALSPAMASADALDADRATARVMAEEGQGGLARGDYRLAEDRFTRADALVHAPTLLLGLARAQAGLGKLVEAHESYRRILREGVKPGSPAPFFKAAEEAEKEVRLVAARLAWITISVSPAPDPEVSLDGTALPKAALGFRRPVNPGAHVIRARAAGYAGRDGTLSVNEGENTALELVLARLPSGASSAPEPIASPPLAVGHDALEKGHAAVRVQP